MADNWYYVQKGNRHGPVGVEVIESMISKQELKDEDFIWKKGFENWKKIKEVPEFQVQSMPAPEAPVPVAPPMQQVAPTPTPAPKVEATSAPVSIEKELSFKELGFEERVIFIRIGNDRGGSATDYGPFSIRQLKQLYRENRINGKTFVFTTGMKEWKLLADLPEYQEIFEELPPVIKESERRFTVRKPFVARLFIQNNKNFFEGICRDISIGGMQILIDNFKGIAGDKITMNVHPENSDYHFTASGVVVRILEGNSGISFRFQGLSDEAKRSIEKYVQEN
jgi:hypothetical protein